MSESPLRSRAGLHKMNRTASESQFPKLVQQSSPKVSGEAQNKSAQITSFSSQLNRPSGTPSHSRGSLRPTSDFNIRIYQTPKHRKSNSTDVEGSTTKEESKASQNPEIKRDISSQRLAERPKNKESLAAEKKKYNQLMAKIVANDPLAVKPQSTVEEEIKIIDSFKTSNPTKSPHSKSSKSPINFAKNFLEVRPRLSRSEKVKEISDLGVEVQTTEIDPALTAEILEEIHTNKTKYNFSNSDSKFEEIVGLRRMNVDLQLKNIQLKKDVAYLDEFKMALDKPVNVERFHEKRIDILKAQVSKQKRYIDYLTKALKLTKTFYKDQTSVLNYLIDLEKKAQQSKGGAKDQNAVVNMVEANQKRAMQGVIALNENPEEFQKFMRNFNEAYEKVRAAREKEEEVKKLFSVTIQALKAKDMISHRINPQLQKKIRYNSLLYSFIEKYKMYFPVYTLFDEYEFLEKRVFGDFLQSLVKQSEKIEEVFSKIKYYDTLRHNPYPASREVINYIKEHGAEFDEYFNRGNKGKRLILDGEKINEVEKSLSDLLNSLINFQKLMMLDKNKITVEYIIEMQKKLTANIEKLLTLGVATDLTQMRGAEILVVNENKKSIIKGTKLLAAEGKDGLTDKINRFEAEIYSWKEQTFREFDNYKQGSHYYINELRHTLKSLTSNNENKAKEVENSLTKLKTHVDYVIRRYDESHAYQSLQRFIIEYQKELVKTLAADAATTEQVVKEKSEHVDLILRKVTEETKELLDCFENYFEKGGEGDVRMRMKLILQFKRVFGEVFNYMIRALTGKDHPIRDQISKLDDEYREEFEKVKSDLLYFSDRNSKIIGV